MSLEKALTIVNRYINNGEIAEFDLNRLEVLIAMKQLEMIKDKLIIGENGKLEVKYE